MSYTTEDRFDNLVNQLDEMVQSATSDQQIPSFELRRVLRFLNKVIQIVEQSFEDVLATIIELKYATEADRRSGRLDQLSKELDLLSARSRYRDAEEICSRLHHLREYYDSDIEPITRHLVEKNKWRSVFSLLDQYEGQIIMLVNASIYELQQLLRRQRIKEINVVAEKYAQRIRDSLTKLRLLNGKILGLSGNQSLLELSEDKSLMNVFVNRGGIEMGDTYQVGQAGAVGPNAHAHDMTFTQLESQLQDSVDFTQLASELSKLRQAMMKEATEAEHSIAVGEVAKAEQAAKSKDATKVADCLKSAGKWALDIASKIGVPLAVEALKQVMGIPL